MILLTGYWPPTDIGVTARKGMLDKWKVKGPVTFAGKTYDVLSASPSFANSIGWADPAKTIPYWGKGTGTLTVDYRDTSTDFWSIVATNRPIAIMSFSRGFADKSWELEAKARNLARSQWIINLDYIDLNNVQKIQTWDAPFIGGSAADPSPYKNDGAITGNPPDRSQAAGASRDSNLPMQSIVNAIASKFPNPPGNIDPKIDPSGDVGSFVSEFMAYHVGWYRDYSQTAFATDPAKQCKFAGHTHVGVNVTVADAEIAVETQLEELFKVLP